MKKTKLSLCLASSFVAALSLAACSGSVNAKKDAVVTVKDYNGNEVTLLTDAVYNKYKTDSNGISKFYNAILETLVRYEYQNANSAVRIQQWTKGIKSNSDGELVAVLGPNGHGKSTLLNVIMGHPKYKVTEGSITYGDKDLLSLSTDERSKLGIFLGFQNPVEIPGVSNSDFLRAAVNARNDKPISTYNFYKILDQATKEVKIPFDFVTRNLNEGFSGGEKKRNEILQLLLLKPSLAMLDEIDSGLDVDAIQVVADVINKEKTNSRSFMVISHYARLFDLIHPTRAVVIVNGRVAIDGDKDIVKRIDTEGYEFIKTEYGIEIEKEEQNMNKVSIGTCAVKETIK